MLHTKKLSCSLALFFIYMFILLMVTRCASPISPQIEIEPEPKTMTTITFVNTLDNVIWLKTSQCTKDNKFLFSTTDTMISQIKKDLLPITFYFKIMHHFGGTQYFVKRKVIHTIDSTYKDTTVYIY